MSNNQRPWSKLQRELYKLVSDDINFQIHCAVYPMKTRWGSTDLPRYWITLDKEIIWDYPGQFTAIAGSTRNLVRTPEGEFIGSRSILTKNTKTTNLTGCTINRDNEVRFYPFTTDVSDISDLLREYIDTPKEEILSKVFVNDHWGLINILRAADRRIGTRRLDALRRKTHNVAANKIITARMKLTPARQAQSLWTKAVRKRHTEPTQPRSAQDC